MPVMCLVQQLKAMRRKKGLSREDVARLVGVSLMTVNRWEKESCEPSKLAQEKIKKVLDVL